MTIENNYTGEVYEIITNSENPPFYFVNILNSEGTSNPNSHIWEFKNLDKAKNTILETMAKDDILKNKDLSKFVIAFPFGFVVYSWGDKKETPDFNLMKQGEWEFSSSDYTKAERQDNLPIFCPLENLIKSQETQLWCSENIKTISNYYAASREKLSTQLKHADKPFY